jgi:hypothetical protein
LRDWRIWRTAAADPARPRKLYASESPGTGAGTQHATPLDLPSTIDLCLCFRLTGTISPRPSRYRFAHPVGLLAVRDPPPHLGHQHRVGNDVNVHMLTFEAESVPHAMDRGYASFQDFAYLYTPHQAGPLRHACQVAHGRITWRVYLCARRSRQRCDLRSTRDARVATTDGGARARTSSIQWRTWIQGTSQTGGAVGVPHQQHRTARQ